MRIQGIIALAVVALAVAACGGGGGGGSSTGSSGSVLPTSAPTLAATTAPATSAPLPAGFLVANVSITVPKGSFASSTSRSAQTVGTGTASITFSLLELNGATASSTPQSYGLTTTSPGCSTQPVTGNLVCSLNINAPIGSDIFLAQTYTGANGTGSLTGSGAVQLSVAQNASNTASLALSGQVASIFLAASGPYIGAAPSSLFRRNAAVVGTGPTLNQLQLFVIALDSSNNVILNPSVFTSPVYVQLFYPSGGQPDVTLQVVPGSEGGATTSTSANYGSIAVNSPSDVITASIIPNVVSEAASVDVIGHIGSPYLVSPQNPNPAPSALINFQVTQPAAPSGQIVLYSNDLGGNLTSLSYLGIDNDFLEVYESGYTGTYTDNVASCSGIVGISFFANSNGSAEFQLTGGTVGSCTFSVSDGIGNTINIPITVTTTAVTGS